MNLCVHRYIWYVCPFIGGKGAKGSKKVCIIYSDIHYEEAKTGRAKCMECCITIEKGMKWNLSLLFTYINTFMHMFVHIHMYVYIHMYILICKHMLYVYIHTCMHICSCIYKYIIIYKYNYLRWNKALQGG
jgi:hypothetical protein